VAWFENFFSNDIAYLLVFLGMTNKEWFATWFDTPYYHQLYQHRNEDEARLFIQQLIAHIDLPVGSQVLDLACGKGRHAKTLHDLGLNVLGVDLSPNSIEEASKMSKDGLEFAVHDMREVIFNKQFQAVFNLFTSFGYFDTASENEKVLNAIAEMLAEDGLLIIDFMNARKVLNSLVEQEEKTIGNLTFRIQRLFDGQHIYKHIRFHDNGQDFHFTERVQALQLKDFKALLEKHFAILSTFGDFNLTPFEETTSDRLIIIAQKK
jgi:2-polyprenyl-3-methyl-5-hydroxy-6-metoxy-1,4-benzoquinol methylase